MSREKQIEEMTKATMKHCKIDNQCGSCHWSTCNECLSEVLYNAGYRKQEWISVDERLPEKDGMYLIFSPYTNKEGGIIYCNRFLTKGNTIFQANSFESITKVTHWMPLPEAPKMKGSKAEEIQKKHFTPEDVRKMSQGEVRENYQAIMDSMKKWE